MLTNLVPQKTKPGRPQRPMQKDSRRQTMSFGPRRGVFINAADYVEEKGGPLDPAAVTHCETFDLVYRTLCAASRRLDFLRPIRRTIAVRRDGLRFGEAEPDRRGHYFLCSRP
jgi:hypothetical protein